MAASIEEVGYELGGASGIAIIGSISTLFYTLAMKIPEGIHVPSNVKDSLDEALLAAESLPPASAESLTNAAFAAFDQSFFVVIAGVTVFLFIAALIMSWVAVRLKRTKKHSVKA
ncbi:hypothetical protein [Paenibacillus sp. Z3-2]